MRKKLGMLFMSILMTVQLVLPAVGAYADPVVIGDDETAVADASNVNDEEAVAQANADEQEGPLADPAEAAAYLLANAQDNLIHQVPTDEHDTSFPEKYDLRDLGVVTPVKFQNPWGTCWGFSAIAACETSILSAMGKTYEETGLDLSEHHLTYFSRTYLQDGSSQDGEGIHMIDAEKTLNTGGNMFTASSVFSSGIGPVSEAVIPYRGKESKTDHVAFMNFNYSADDDWTISSDYEFLRAYDLSESNILPETAVYETGDWDEDDEDEREAHYLGYDASAVDAWKSEIMKGNAISVAFCADTYMPGQTTGGVAMYLNTEDNKWTHYTFDGGVANHAVTIVGWDDTIPASDFLDHTDDEYGDGLAHQPEGDGAWIVKNSWGASTEIFPNMFIWGIDDDEGQATGYFYISYYDRSITLAETFNFDLSTDVSVAEMVDQYDFMQTSSAEGWADENGLQMANVFTAEADGDINYVSCQTDVQNMSTTYQVYLLNDDAMDPDDGTLAATVSEDYAYAGYHKAKLPTPVHVEKGQRYSVVVTSCFTSGDKVYYDFSTATGENEAAVTEYNRKIRYRNRSEAEEDYIDQLKVCYSKAVVNPGESYVYMNALGQWGDFSAIIPYLQQDEEYKDYDFDNFPIKAYLSYSNEDEAIAAAESKVPEDLNFADAASPIYFRFILFILLGVVVLIVLIVLIIKGIIKKHKRKKYIKELEQKVPQLEAEIASLRSRLSD